MSEWTYPFLKFLSLNLFNLPPCRLSKFTECGQTPQECTVLGGGV